MKDLIISAMKVGALAYVGVMALVYLIQERLMFYPTKLAQDYKFQFNTAFEEKWTDFGKEKIHSLLFKAPASRGVIIYFHGNAGSLENWGEVAERLCRELHWDVWMFDYPGYGKSSGKITSQEQLLKLAQAIYDDVKKEYPTQDIVVFGRSIGSGPAVHLAANNPVKKLILETPYLSLKAIAGEAYPYVPIALLKYQMPSNEWIQKVQAPIMILHGTNDEVIPIHHAVDLSKIAKGAKFVQFEGGYHNDLSDFKQYKAALQEFLN
jgi:Hydrolases of the alpha/beta superfamily